MSTSKRQGGVGSATSIKVAGQEGRTTSPINRKTSAARSSAHSSIGKELSSQKKTYGAAAVSTAEKFKSPSVGGSVRKQLSDSTKKAGVATGKSQGRSGSSLKQASETAEILTLEEEL